MFLSPLSLFGIVLHVSRSIGVQDYSDSADLTSFISRPDLKAPRFDVKTFDGHRPTPGYWFVAPYSKLDSEPYTKLFRPYQVGPHIYDNDGELVWSVAGMFRNRNAYDFRIVDIQDVAYLSLILGSVSEDQADMKGVGILLESHLEVKKQVFAPRQTEDFNIHEFNTANQGSSHFIILSQTQLCRMDNINTNYQNGWVKNQGFQEIDANTGRAIFEWWALDHIHFDESAEPVPNGPGSSSIPWDFLHLNSIEKDPEGNYLISARNTNCIYKISGKSGDILWRLGGKNSSFALDDLEFSSQHDARYKHGSSSSYTISFLDNAVAAAKLGRLEAVSSALIVSLETSKTPPVARLLNRYPRPDGRVSFLRGNAQVLPNGNVFVGWSAEGYLGEFTQDGHCVLEARFLSNRFNTYRAYKFNYTVTPIELPTLRTYAYGTSASMATTIFYVSWNGATEVASWSFFVGHNPKDEFTLIGQSPRSGFETVFQVSGNFEYSFAEALDANGKSLGESKVQQTNYANEGWRAALLLPSPSPIKVDELKLGQAQEHPYEAAQINDGVAAKIHQQPQSNEVQTLSSQQPLRPIHFRVIVISLWVLLMGVLARFFRRHRSFIRS